MQPNDAAEARLARAIELLRDDVAVDAADFDARVLAAIGIEDRERHTAPRRAPERTPLQRVWALRPHVWLGAALAAGIGGLAVARGLSGPPPGSAKVATRNGQQLVRFQVTLPRARSVAVAGSFNKWNPAATPLHRVGDTTWVAQVPLQAGRYVYQFVIDNHTWISDPSAPRDAADEFGAANSVLTVATRGGA